MFTKRIIPCLDVNNGPSCKRCEFCGSEGCRGSGGDCEGV